ncbi:MAG TPA: efflux RND transporter periplasmic adaptor subunit [Aliiroseovarius sp.]|nr:efflux RND transporter periplasmic adaptor subunit [Aliiroseovarius sp.]
MRIFPILSAILVTAGLYLLIFEREQTLDFARNGLSQFLGTSDAGGDADADDVAAAADSTDPVAADPVPGAERAVSVIAMRSIAREIDSAVLLRGRTEASRQVQVQAETSGQVISTPLRKGVSVAEGDLLCRLDPGTRAIALTEARARLAEAEARVPEALARVAEAESRVPAMKAALAEAVSRVPATEASLAEAKSRITSAQATIADANARIPAAEARVAEARARLTEAEINLNAAEKLAEGGFASDTRVANARAALESARAGVENALSQLESTKAGVQSAKSQLEGALAGVQSAKSQIEAAKAGIESAKSQVESAAAGVQSAKSQVENAKAGVQSAEAAVAAAEREISRLEIHAPFGGLLETDTAELGSLLQPGAPCATIVQIDPIKLVGFVPEVSVDKVHTGVVAGGRLTNGTELVGRVTFVSRVSDPLTRTFRVEIEVPNPDQTISDGLTVEILISSDGRSAHLLPQSSLTLDDEGNLGVRVVADGDQAKFAPVELIRDSIEGVWVSGLPPEVAVIIVGQDYVKDGVPLDVTYREPDA